MRPDSLDLLKDLLDAPSPSGYEQPAAAVYRAFASKYADDVATDVMGSVAARLAGNAGGPSVMLAGHMDEIGFMVSYVMPEGFIAFKCVGGVDAHIMPGKRVRVVTRDGELLGVIGRLPIHLLEEDERKQVAKMHKFQIDLGLSGDEARAKVRIGDPVVFDMGFAEFGDDMAVGRAFDDKMGVWIAGEVLRRVKESGGAAGDLIAVATVQEEVGMRGGRTSAYSVDPAVGIAVEVCHATDYPDCDRRRYGDIKCGGGPVIARGPNINPKVFDLLVAAAEAEKLPYQLDAEPRGTGTDANVIQLSRGGKAAALVSVALRYMHTPSEVLSLADLENTARLLTAFVKRLEPGTDFTP
jgi:putative aminopeptidase FrvX